jgi:iron complex outermembrane receptor protein
MLFGARARRSLAALACAGVCAASDAAAAPVPKASPATPVPKASPPRAPVPSDSYRTVVRADTAPTAAQRRLDAGHAGFATAIDLAHERGARPSDALPELLARTAGVTVRSLGGLGQFSAISLRGSSAQQVGVFLDGVPIGGGSSGVVNLADLPLDTLRGLVVYRGLVPAAYGGAAIGGAVDLGSDLRCAQDRRRFTAALGVGSFAAREARAGASVPLAPRRRGPCLDVRVGYAGARGDFRFYNIGETPQNPADDRDDRRANNHYDRVLAQLAVHGARGPWRYAAQHLLLWKGQGVPGMATGAQATRSALDTVVGRTVVRVRRDLDDARRPGQVELVAGLAADRARYRDPLGEVGLAVDDQRTRTVDLYASPRVHLHTWRGASLSALFDARHEWTRVEQFAWAGAAGDARRRRLTTGAGLQLDQRLFGDRLYLQPVLRLDVVRSRFAVPPGAGEQDDQGRDHLDVGFSPRMGARVALTDTLALRASGGRYFRPPAPIELFGDRGFVAGNEGLRPERGTGIDAGLTLDTRGPVALYAHAAGFVVWSEDLIQWQQSGPRLRPVNLDDARVAGLESAADLRVLGGDLALRANYTLLAPINRSSDPSTRGRQLPGRPRHELLVQGSIGHVWKARSTELEPRLVYTLEHAARTFLDPSGRFEVPRRTLHGLAAELHVARRVHLACEVRNLLDLRTTLWRPPVAGAPALPVPVSDFFFYPLPGTSLWASLRLDLDAPIRAPS